MERERFLARVQAALQQGDVIRALAANTPGYPGNRDPVEHSLLRGVHGLSRSDHPGHDPASWAGRFGRELEAAKGSWTLAGPGAPGVATACVAYAERHRLRRVVAWDPAAVLPAGAGAMLAAALNALEAESCEVTRWRSDDMAALRRAAAEAQLGIVVAQYAIATSGTVAVVHGPGRGRAVSLLPEHLLVLVPRSVLVPTLADALANLATRYAATDPAAAPQNITLITGPSKSSDIELHPVVGVHGPRFVHAVIYGDHEDAVRT